MGLPYEYSDIEAPDKIYHKLAFSAMLVLVVVALIGAMQSSLLFVGSLGALAVVGAAVAVWIPLIARRKARATAEEIRRWPEGTNVVCRTGWGDPRAQLIKDRTTLTIGEYGFSYYDPGTSGVGGPSWSASWPGIIRLSLTLVPDQPLTGVLEIVTAEGTNYFAVYEWGELSAYLRKKIVVETETDFCP
jgi:hypothetical protein